MLQRLVSRLILSLLTVFHVSVQRLVLRRPRFIDQSLICVARAERRHQLFLSDHAVLVELLQLADRKPRFNVAHEILLGATRDGDEVGRDVEVLNRHGMTNEWADTNRIVGCEGPFVLFVVVFLLIQLFAGLVADERRST